MMNPIVGIGEVLWDVYPGGRKVAGGAPFNFAFHCHQLGHPAVIASRVGNDDLGRELRARVRALGLSDEYIQTDHDHPTGTVQVTLGADAVPTYTITENVAWDHLAWNDKLEGLAKTCRAVCFGTLAQRSQTTANAVSSFASAASDGLLVFDVNMRGELTHGLRNLIDGFANRVHWFKVNVEELDRLLENTVWEPLPRKQSTIRLAFDPGTDPKRVGVLTRGPKGAVVADWQRTDWVPGVPADVVDTVGAGDAFTAAMVCLRLEGKSLRECARFAVCYAARVCEQPGGTPKVERAEVERAAGLSS